MPDHNWTGNVGWKTALRIYEWKNEKALMLVCADTFVLF